MKFAYGFLAATVIASWAAFAEGEGETVYVGQEIGSIAIVSSSHRTIVPVAFQELSAVDGQNVCISNILRTTNLLPGDQVFLYTSAGYQSWKLNDNLVWVDNDETFALKADGSTETGVGDKATETRPSVGEGFWLYRRDDRDWTKPFYIFGAYAQTKKTITISAGKTLLGNPTIETKIPTITTPENGEHLYIEQNGDLKDYSFTINTKYPDGVWAHKDGGKIVKENTPPALAPGQGFWYTTNQSQITFEW